ncbi:MAG: SWI/SNF-related matrix-associated actin-dependent regulator of chromatin subfamily A-like protein 1 [Marteilia pararefringens]
MLNSLCKFMVSKQIRFITISGSTKAEKRNELCNEFQKNPNIMCGLLSITACGVGLNLNAASLVIFAELFWNPGALMQAEDRAHRLGQTRPVEVKYLLAKGTIDDHIWPLLVNKLNFLTKTGLSNENFNEFEDSLLQASIYERT